MMVNLLRSKIIFDDEDEKTRDSRKSWKQRILQRLYYKLDGDIATLLFQYLQTTLETLTTF